MVATLGGLLFGYDTAVISGTVESLSINFINPLQLSENVSSSLKGFIVSSALIGCIIGGAITGWMSMKLGRKLSLIIGSLLFFISAIGSAIPEIGYTDIGNIDITVLVLFIIYRIIGGIGVGMVHAVNEYNNIKKSLELSLKQPKTSFAELLSGKIKVAMIIGLALAFFQQISGINAVLYYAPMVFETAGGGRDAAFLQSVILGFVFIGGTIISMFLIDKLGRKPLLIIGSALMALSLLITGFAFNNARYSLDQREIEVIGKSFYEKAILNEAMVSNPNNYSTDSIKLGNRKAFLYKGGNTIAEVDLNKATIVSIGKEMALLKEALLRFEGMVYFNETDFFSSIKNELSSLVAINLKKSSLKAQDPFYELIHSKTSGTFSSEEIAGIKVSEYKPLILSNAIEINSNMVLIGILGFIFGFSISLGPVMWAMLAEIFPNKLRGIAISVAGTFNAITSFFVASIFPAELDYLGSAITYYIFAGFMILCLFFVWKYVYETKGKTLEELESDLISEGGIKEVYYAH